MSRRPASARHPHCPGDVCSLNFSATLRKCRSQAAASLKFDRDARDLGQRQLPGVSGWPGCNTSAPSRMTCNCITSARSGLPERRCPAFRQARCGLVSLSQQRRGELMAQTGGMLEVLNRGRAELGVHVSKTTGNKIGASPDKVHDRIVRVTRHVSYGSMLSKNYSTDAGNLEAECFGRLEVKHKFKLRPSSAGSSRFHTVLSSKNRGRAMGIEEVLTAPRSPDRSKIP
jgi:hypothetical protein